MHRQRILATAVAGLVASALIGFHPTGSRAQATTSYTVVYKGTADFSTTTVSGPLAGSKFHWHAEWTATGGGTDLVQDAGGIQSNDDYQEFPVAAMTTASLLGSEDALEIGEPQGQLKCNAKLLPRDGGVFGYGLGIAQLDPSPGKYHLGVYVANMPLSDAYLYSDKNASTNAQDYYCELAPTPNAFHVDNFPNVPAGKITEFNNASIPLIDVYPIDPSQAFDSTQEVNFDYTGPTNDPNGPVGTTVYDGHIHSTIEISTAGSPDAQ